MPDAPKVLISIVNWNKLDDTIECLESVFKTDYPNYIVIVVDNASSDSSASVIRAKYHRVIVLENKENLGFTGGHNVGMRYAMDHGADYVWLLNNDAIVESDTLSVLIDAAMKDASIGLVSPQVNYYGDPTKVQFKGSYFDWKRFEEVLSVGNSDGEDVKYRAGENVILWGTALLIRRSVIEKIGYLDERFFAYSEDLDYSIRALKAEFRNLLHVGARILHKNDPRWYENRPAYYYYYMTRNWFLLRSVYLRGWRRIDMHRKYLANVLSQISYFVKHRNGHDEYLGAVIGGAWHGVMRVSGRMSFSPNAPYIFEKMLLFFGRHPPYLWSCLIDGQFGLVLKRGIMKCKTYLLQSR